MKIPQKNLFICLLALTLIQSAHLAFAAEEDSSTEQVSSPRKSVSDEDEKPQVRKFQPRILVGWASSTYSDSAFSSYINNMPSDTSHFGITGDVSFNWAL